MRKEKKTEITRGKILNAALSEFGKNGYDNAKINNICHCYNISKGLIYYNYNSKEELYQCCVQYAVDAFVSYMKAQDIGCDLQLYMKLRCRFFNENQALGRLIFDLLLQPSDSLSDELLKAKNEFDNFNLALYKEAVKSLKLRSGVSEENAAEYYNMLQNMLNSFISRQPNDKTSFGATAVQHEKQLENILNYMLYGIAEE